MTTPPLGLQRSANPKPAYRMDAMLLGIGTLHFVAPKPFDGIVPDRLPGSRRFYTYASGVAELVTGALLLSSKTRKVGALSAAALYLAVFPANVNMCVLWKDKPLLMRLGAFARLPLQIPMVLGAWKIYRNS